MLTKAFALSDQRMSNVEVKSSGSFGQLFAQPSKTMQLSMPAISEYGATNVMAPTSQNLNQFQTPKKRGAKSKLSSLSGFSQMSGASFF